MLLPIALMLASLALPRADNRIAVHVRAGRAAPAADGFTEPARKDLTDSARDIAAQLAKSKRLRLVADESEADVLILVTNRGVESSRNGGLVTMPMGNALVTMPTDDSWRVVRVRLKAGTYSKDYVGALNWATSTWSGTAKKASEQIRAWIEENAETLIARRAETR